MIASAMASPEDRDRARDAGKPFIGLCPICNMQYSPLRDVLDEDEIFLPNPLRGPHRNKNPAAQSYLAHDRLIQHFASATYKGSPAYIAMHRLNYKDQNQIALHRLILQEHGLTFPPIAVGTPDDDVLPAPVPITSPALAEPAPAAAAPSVTPAAIAAAPTVAPAAITAAPSTAPAAAPALGTAINTVTAAPAAAPTTTPNAAPAPAMNVAAPTINEDTTHALTLVPNVNAAPNPSAVPALVEPAPAATAAAVSQNVADAPAAADTTPTPAAEIDTDPAPIANITAAPTTVTNTTPTVNPTAAPAPVVPTPAAAAATPSGAPTTAVTTTTTEATIQADVTLTAADIVLGTPSPTRRASHRKRSSAATDKTTNKKNH